MPTTTHQTMERSFYLSIEACVLANMPPADLGTIARTQVLGIRALTNETTPQANASAAAGNLANQPNGAGQNTEVKTRAPRARRGERQNIETRVYDWIAAQGTPVKRRAITEQFSNIKSASLSSALNSASKAGRLKFADGMWGVVTHPGEAAAQGQRALHPA